MVNVEELVRDDALIEQDLLDAQGRLNEARVKAAEAAAARSELFAEAIGAGWSIYRIHTLLGLNRNVVERELDRRLAKFEDEAG